MSGCYLLTPSSTVPATPVCIIHTHMYDIYYIILHITIFHMYSIIICVVYVTLFVASHLLLLQYQVVICSPLLQLFLLLMSALYTLYHTYMCYSYIHIFNYNMCYSYISYHNVTLCALHPHPYYTIHHHQHSHQLTLKL